MKVWVDCCIAEILQLVIICAASTIYATIATHHQTPKTEKGSPGQLVDQDWKMFDSLAVNATLTLSYWCKGRIKRRNTQNIGF